MISTVHERPGVYSSYEASSVVSGSCVGKTVGVAALAQSGTANTVVTITSLAEGVETFGSDAANAPAMEKMLRLLFANGAGTVKAVRVGLGEGNAADYSSAFAALAEEEDIGIVVCDSASSTVQQALRTSLESCAAARRERIAIVGGSNETAAQMVTHAAALNSERMVLVGPDMTEGAQRISAAFAAAAVAGVLSKTEDASVPINGASLGGIGALALRLSDTEIDTLVRGGVTPIECVGGICSPVRGITTKTTTGGAADTTWRELTTILVVDEVIPSIRSALRTRFARARNNAQTRGAIRSQVVLELEEKVERELIDSYGDVAVSALASDPTVCEVSFSFAVTHGLNRIYLTAQITV